MKAYTDIEQSRKLAEIQSIESADMRFCFNHTLDGRITGHYPMIGREPSMGTIPCWSLAALLDVLPLEIEIHTQTDGHKIYYYVESYMKRMGKEIYLSTERHENLVDACYEMIIKLNERKLL